MEKSAQLERLPPPLGGYAPAGSSGPQAALRPRFALPPGIPQGLTAPRPSASPQIEAPRGGRMTPSTPPPRRLTGERGAPRPPGLEEGAGHGLSAEQAHQVRDPSPIPPAPSRWEGERVALCRQGCRPRGASLASPAPLTGSVGSFQGHQGFASPRSSPVRCSGFALRSACGFRSSP